jgi:hypothetical protein
MNRIRTSMLALALSVAAFLVVVNPMYAAVQVPFTATFSGTAGFTGPASGRYDGTGTATQLGAATVHGDINVIGTPACGGFTAQHNDVLTAANGDQIHLQVTEDACPTAQQMKYNCAGTYIVVGGTGRFKNATGQGALRYYQWLTRHGADQ